MKLENFHILLPKKKYILQIYFIIFILLNIADFMGKLQGDIDFFKKILSWLIIGYIFYKASITELFLGYRDKVIDLFLIFSFSLISIVKAILHYANVTHEQKFYIFAYPLKYLSELSTTQALEITQTLFIIGFLLIVLISIALLRTYDPTDKSLLKSLNIKGYFKFIGGQYLTLIFTLTFFAMIVFNFFMEWFALAIDSIILVIGLLYYLIYYIHKHTEMETSKYLKQVSNTGNLFYNNLIKLFSNKKTFLLGTSIILTIHLIVDIGVYILPYTIGLENTLYENTLDIPIYSLKDPNQSRLLNDLSISQNFITDLILIISHISTIIFFILILFGPFYYFYKFIQKNKTHSPKLIKHIFLVSAILYLSILLIPNLNPPIEMTNTYNYGIIGVDFTTNQIININQPFPHIELLILLIIFIIANIEIKYVVFKTEHRFLKYKLMPIIAIIFFIIYISLFFTSVISNDYNSLKNDLKLSSIKEKELSHFELNNNKFNEINNKLNTIGNGKLDYFDISIKSSQTRAQIKENDEHKDYLLIENINSKTPVPVRFKNYENIYFNDNNNYNINNYLLKTNNSRILIYLGKEIIQFQDNQINTDIIYKTFINNIMEIKENNPIEIFGNIIRVIFISIFYIFGSIAFVNYFIKEKILD